VNPDRNNQKSPDAVAVLEFYDRVYYGNVAATADIPLHYQRLARKFQPWSRQRLLDVACGTGTWLRAAAALGAVLAALDISQKALDICRQSLPQVELRCGQAERLPFADQQFDVISCLGALEHFLDPTAALREMVRVAKPSALFLLLVPSSGFLPRRLGLYSGTQQADVREVVRSLAEWSELFASAGLRVRYRWKDLHVLSPSWIFRDVWFTWPLRAAQALVSPFWPLSWQYPVYHLCAVKN
jgi:SAM-dependent methyltransferase